MELNSKDKGELRKYWKSQYPKFRSFFPAWSEAICQQILSHPHFQKAQKIAVFYPRDWEVNLNSIWETRPLDCAYPKTDSQTWEMKFYTVEALEVPNMVLGPGRVWEPQADKSREVVSFGLEDLILVPGLVFDLKGTRVGSGKGVYDKFLAREGKLAQKWGVAFSPQVIPTPIDRKPYDTPLDALVTEKGFIYF